jgi:Asp-tRNA(Asn)/Glu-tRNA(Gln) amidotransferase A subunit family amidase
MLSFDLDEGWEQSITLAAKTLEEAQKEAVDILHDFNSNMDDSDFKIYEFTEEHTYWMDDEPMKTHWANLDKEAWERVRAHREKSERDNYESLKKKYGD